MNIVVEASVFGSEGTGVARYLSNMLKYWDHFFNEHKYYVLLKNNNFAFANESKSIIPIVIPYYQKRNLVWQQLAVPRIANQFKNTIYFAPNYTLPLALKMPSVLVIHDLSFFHYKQHRYFKNVFLKVLIRMSINKANLCLTDTHFIEKDALSIFNKKIDKKINVVYLAYQNSFLEPSNLIDSKQIMQKYSITSDYFLSVGLIFTRRLPEILLQSFKQLIEKDNQNFMLVLVGENRTCPYINLDRLIEKLGLKNNVNWIPRVSEEELKTLYYGCKAFVYLSEYEGFGIPILEAIACRKNVVCSDIEVFRELFTGACYFADNKNPAHIASKMIEAMKVNIPEEKLRQCLSRFSWEKSAAETMQIMQSLKGFIAIDLKDKS